MAEDCVKKLPRKNVEKNNLLIWNAFSAHLISAVKKKVKLLHSEKVVVSCD